MDWNRRDFLAAGTLAVAALASPPAGASAFATPLAREGPAYLEGDRYLATAPEPGLKGRSFDEARDLALRFRTPAVERDRLVLGLPEALHA